MLPEIVKHYGLNAQLNMVMEESGELISVCTNLLASAARAGCIDRKLIEDEKGELVEELAHVKNTILSVCYLLYVPTSRLEENGAIQTTESVWGDTERGLLSLCGSCGCLIKYCNKLLRVNGVGYKSPVSQETALTNLVNAMCHAWRDILALCTLLGISQETLDDEIRRSDKVTLDRMH